MRGWLGGLVVGLVGGFATLVVSPVAGLPVLLLAAALSVKVPRMAGPAGVLVGHGGAWSALLANASMACATSDPPQCGWSMFAGSWWLRPAAAWQTEPTDIYFGTVFALIAVALSTLIAGLVLTLWTARGVRRRRLATAPRTPSATT